MNGKKTILLVEDNPDDVVLTRRSTTCSAPAFTPAATPASSPR